MLNQVWTEKVFNSKTISSGSSEKSAEIPLYLANGNCSLQVEVTGDGTVKFEYELKNDINADYLIPSDASAIATSITKSSGSDGNGKDHFSFSVAPAIKAKIKATETGGANSVTVTAWLAML